MMGKGIFASASLIALLASNAASAADLSVLAPSGAVPYAWGDPAPYPKDWDKRIGYDFWTRLVNYYALEMGHDAPPHRRDQAKFRGQSADDGACQHVCRQSAQRSPHPDLWLGQFWRQPQHQHREAGRQLACRLHVYAEHGAARSGRDLHRAAARYGAERPRRLGLPTFRDVWRELSLHDLLWPGELSAAQS